MTGLRDLQLGTQESESVVTDIGFTHSTGEVVLYKYQQKKWEHQSCIT